MHKWMLWTHIPAIMFAFSSTVKYKKHDKADYSKYLGPDYLKNEFKGKRVSTLVCNHIGFLEILGWMASIDPPGFIVGEHIKKFVMGDFYVKCLQSIYIDREKSKTDKDAMV